MVLSFLAMALGAMVLPPDQQAIATRVAGAGLPECRVYNADGSEGPCLPTFAVTRGGAINGRSNAGHITFSQGTMTRLTADEFALLAGHEIAHWYLGHQRSSIDAELAADRLGAQLACRAGYDAARGSTVFRFVGQGRTHPPRDLRRAAVLEGCPNPAPLGPRAGVSG